MSGTTINRGEASAIPFVINDANSGLAGKRVTFSVSLKANGARVLRKVSGMGVTSADVTITAISATQITGTINIAAADFAQLAAPTYVFTLWIDDNTGNDRCVTVGGVETLTITDDVPRPA